MLTTTSSVLVAIGCVAGGALIAWALQVVRNDLRSAYRPTYHRYRRKIGRGARWQH